MSRPIKRSAPAQKSGLGYFISIALSISIILSVIAIAVALQPEAEAKPIRASLVVEDVYFITSPGSYSQYSEDKQVTMTAFITNKGDKDAASVIVKAFAIDSDTNLGVDYSQATLGLIPKDTTGETTMTLEVPEGNSYRIELIVFESGKIVVRGSGTIKLIGSSGSAGEDWRTEIPLDDEDKKRSGIGASLTMSDEDAGSSAAAFAALAIVILVIIIIAVVAAVSGNKTNNKEEPEIKHAAHHNTSRPQPSPDSKMVLPTPESHAANRMMYDQEA
jgi:hypothetical protein